MKQLAVHVDSSSARARGTCGCIIPRGQPYWIIVFKSAMHAVCSSCKTTRYNQAHLCMRVSVKQVPYLMMEKNKLFLRHNLR